MKQIVNLLAKKLLPASFCRRILKIYVRFKLFGFGYKCPFCRKSFRQFFPAGIDRPVFKEKNIIGGGYRLNARCPWCNSSDRERLVYLYLKKYTDIFEKPIKLLHVAPEKNLQEIFKKHSNLDYVSADLNSPLAMVKMDITDIGYGNDFFDVIICNHVFEHILDDRKAMAEILRVLKPGGWAILQAPISSSLKKTFEDPAILAPADRESKFGQNDHVRIYGADYKERLEAAGFRVSVLNARKTLGMEIVEKFSLLRDENLYVCRK